MVTLAERIELWPIDRLRPYERNPRTHSDAQVDQIVASMVEFGWTMLHVQSKPAADLHAAAGADQGQAHLMTVFQGAVDAVFAKPGSLRCAAVATPCDPLRPLLVEIGQEHHQEADRRQ